VVRKADTEKMPEEVRVPIVPPPAWRGSEDGWHERMAELVAEEEATLLRERIREQRPVMGRQRVLDQKPTSAPRTKPSEGDKINPVLATGGDGELMERLIEELQAWRRAYIGIRPVGDVDGRACAAGGLVMAVSSAGPSGRAGGRRVARRSCRAGLGAAHR
jgi:hypothetical protein